MDFEGSGGGGEMVEKGEEEEEGGGETFPATARNFSLMNAGK